MKETNNKLDSIPNSERDKLKCHVGIVRLSGRKMYRFKIRDERKIIIEMSLQKRPFVGETSRC